MRSLYLWILGALLAAPMALAGSTCNTAPTPGADRVLVQPGATVLFAPTLNDEDPDGDPLLVAAVQNPASACAGTIQDVGDGLVQYISDGTNIPGGSCSVGYTVSDGFAQSSGTILLEVKIEIFSDGFESGSTGSWSSAVGN